MKPPKGPGGLAVTIGQSGDGTIFGRLRHWSETHNFRQDRERRGLLQEVTRRKKAHTPFTLYALSSGVDRVGKMVMLKIVVLLH